MSPFTILPVLLPLIGGILLLMARPAGIQTQRILSLILISLLVGVSLVSFKLASTDVMQGAVWYRHCAGSIIGNDAATDLPTGFSRIMVCHTHRYR